jgi:hypothetical protein
MQKGLLQAEALAAARSSDDAAWNAARQDILRANRLAPNDPLILEAYYDSFADQNVLPPAGAQNALFHALQLAPGDDELRYRVAADFERRDMIPEAIAVIRPTALALRELGNEGERARRRREEAEERYRLAGQAHHESAREMLTRLEARLAAHPAPAASASH